MRAHLSTRTIAPGTTTVSTEFFVGVVCCCYANMFYKPFSEVKTAHTAIVMTLFFIIVTLVTFPLSAHRHNSALLSV